MLILILGVALWAAAHLFKRLAPAKRAAMGERGKGLVALALFGSVVLMVIGYKMADGSVFWGRHPATVGINNLLMLFSVYCFAASGMKTALARKMRHPMLIGFKTWALAHLLVNGDVESFVLFGGLMGWAVFQMIKINRAEPDWERPAPALMKKEIMAVVGTVLVYGVIALIHGWVGPAVFG
ncbi:NnrU family protein [Lentibacter sp. XHP0401]|uniref:NnrU family protein n=1 Tax=Lentibacter sp. XHP0401 TaxID=2984334 RepID=UPI0021E8A5F2|nr:NnrU family protein [Lentibacter sp. XHP0401]MCV2894088.1 NnrU family protein [Lentibacter sp. XHP0401]